MEDQKKMITENFLNSILEDYLGEAAGVLEDLSKMPNHQMRADIQKLIDEKIIWQTKNQPSSTLKFTFKFHWSHLTKIQAFCAKYQIQEQKTTAARQRKTYSTKNNPLYKDFFLKFEDSSGRGTVNKGNHFEEVIANRITAMVGIPIGVVETTDPVVYDIMNAGRIVKITEPAKMRGAERNKRDIDISNPPKEEADIGNIISDVDVIGEDKDGNALTVHLSCKQGSVISYINRGVKTEYLLPKELAAEKIVSKKGRALLDMLGIKEGSEEQELFFAIFNKYHHFKDKKETHSKVVDLTKKMSKTKVAQLIGLSIGKGYVLVHEIGGKIEVTRKDALELRNYIKIQRAYADFCLGKKQFEIFVHMTSGKIVKISFRNTQGNVYPTHFMLYWRKDNKK